MFSNSGKQDGITLNHIDIGGGLGIDYHKVLAEHGDPFTIDPKNLAQSVIPLVKETGCELLFEPGRSVIGPGGALLTRVLYTKETKGKRFIIVDAGMSDLIRPSLYGAFHEILPVIPAENDTLTADIVRPLSVNPGIF